MSASHPAPARQAPPGPPPSGLRHNYKADLTAGFLVFLIALPLCLGISMASNFPPISGVLTAIIGGLLATFFGSAPLTIKGPAAGLIVIALGAVTELGGGDAAVGYRRALAVGVVAAAIQIVLALIRAGRLAQVFPASVVHGMLAAIGVIIFAKQAHVALGVSPAAKAPLDLLAEIPHSIANMNPLIAMIGVGSLVILALWPRLAPGKLRKIPAPLVVLVAALPASLAFGLTEMHDYIFAGHHWTVGPNSLVSLPGSLLNAVAFPDFSQIGSAVSIKYVVMFALVGSIESLLSAKAVDALDPWRRSSDLDRDLLATGVANLAASFVGGLPMISEIVRSSANIANGARTRWANFFHGAFLLAFVALLPGLVQLIPLAALAAMLVYTGVRLASPAEFRRTWVIGWDQMVVFLATMITTLATDLLVGVGVGIVVKIALHLVRGAPISRLWKAEVEPVLEGDDGVRLVVRAPAIFTNFLGLQRHLSAAKRRRVVIDLTGAALVDHTVMEKLHDLVDAFAREGRTLEIHGLEALQASSSHPLASHRLRRS
ncbi:MAG: SulP family inorganic anion transporter [Myxococcales bacterium]|nr:SulP family inorganic anion transporter [Myxococcales bacterium]